MTPLSEAEARFRQAVAAEAYDDALPLLTAYTEALHQAAAAAAPEARPQLAQQSSELLAWASRMTRIGRQQAADALASVPAAAAYSEPAPRRSTLAIRG